jgi:molecular chaperone DnaK (HSP70)
MKKKRSGKGAAEALAHVEDGPPNDEEKDNKRAKKPEVAVAEDEEVAVAESKLLLLMCIDIGNQNSVTAWKLVNSLEEDAETFDKRVAETFDKRVNVFIMNGELVCERPDGDRYKLVIGIKQLIGRKKAAVNKTILENLEKNGIMLVESDGALELSYDGFTISAESAMSMLVGDIRLSLEEKTGRKYPDFLCVTLPNNSPQTTKDAYMRVFQNHFPPATTVLRLVCEPFAAVVGCVPQNGLPQNGLSPVHVVVADIGHGTVDMALVSVEHSDAITSVKVKASLGSDSVAGMAFTHALMSVVNAELERMVVATSDQATWLLKRDACVFDMDEADEMKCKIVPLMQNTTRKSIKFVNVMPASKKGKNTPFKDITQIESWEFKTSFLDEVFKTPLQELDEFMNRFKKSIEGLPKPSTIIVVGGGMRGWNVRDHVRAAFLGLDFLGQKEPMYQVALGGLYCASNSSRRLDDNIMTQDIGFVYVKGGVQLVHKIIRRNTHIPTVGVSTVMLEAYQMVEVAPHEGADGAGPSVTRWYMQMDVVSGDFDDGAILNSLGSKVSVCSLKAYANHNADGQKFTVEISMSELNNTAHLKMAIWSTEEEEDAEVTNEVIDLTCE